MQMKYKLKMAEWLIQVTVGFQMKLMINIHVIGLFKLEIVQMLL